MPKDQFNAWIIKVLSIAFAALLSLTTWFAVRMVDNYDSGLKKQEEVIQGQNDMKQTLVGISGRMDLTNQKLDQTIQTEKDHYSEVKKLQQRIYGN